MQQNQIYSTTLTIVSVQTDVPIEKFKCATRSACTLAWKLY